MPQIARWFLTAVLVLAGIRPFAQIDSLLKNVSIGYMMQNDDTPISNLRNYETRKRDDYGMTLFFNIFAAAKLKLFKKCETEIKLDLYSILYTRGLGTTSVISKSNPDFNYYSYLLKKHPDWNDIYVYNQVSVSKTVRQLSFRNKYKNIGIGLDFKNTLIDSDKDQFIIDVQRTWHRFVNTKNYYHKPFTDSSIFKGKSISYFSINPNISFLKNLIYSRKSYINLYAEAGAWINSLNQYKIALVSPYIKSSYAFGLKTLIHKINRLNISYEIYFEPLENFQLYSDPGTNGYQKFSVEINMLGKKAGKMKANKKYCMLYTFSPYTVYSPIGRKEDYWLSYSPPKNDLRLNESFFNFSASMLLK